MVGAAFLEGADAGNFAAVIEMIVEQQSFRAVIDDGGAAGFHLGWRGHLGGGEDVPLSSSTPRSLNMPGLTWTVTAGRASRRWRRLHRAARPCGPMAMGDGDLLDLAEVEGEVAAVADEDRAFGTGVEQEDVLGPADARAQTQAVAQIGGEQRFAGDHLGAAEDDVGKLRDCEWSFADVGVADIVGDDLNGQGIQRRRWKHGCS